jgi:hypothetical protein
LINALILRRRMNSLWLAIGCKMTLLILIPLVALTFSFYWMPRVLCTIYIHITHVVFALYIYTSHVVSCLAKYLVIPRYNISISSYHDISQILHHHNIYCHTPQSLKYSNSFAYQSLASNSPIVCAVQQLNCNSM